MAAQACCRTGTEGKDKKTPQTERAGEGKKILVVISADRLGQGDDDLGGKLLLNFLKTLPEMEPDLWRLVLVNGGVKLVASGHEAVEPLQTLADSGAAVFACGTCLEHFQLLERQVVGEATNMVDIVTAMQLADKVITL